MVNAHKKAMIIGGQKAKNYSYYCACLTNRHNSIRLKLHIYLIRSMAKLNHLLGDNKEKPAGSDESCSN